MRENVIERCIQTIRQQVENQDICATVHVGRADPVPVLGGGADFGEVQGLQEE